MIGSTIIFVSMFLAHEQRALESEVIPGFETCSYLRPLLEHEEGRGYVRFHLFPLIEQVMEVTSSVPTDRCEELASRERQLCLRERFYRSPPSFQKMLIELCTDTRNTNVAILSTVIAVNAMLYAYSPEEIGTAYHAAQHRDARPPLTSRWFVEELISIREPRQLTYEEMSVEQRNIVDDYENGDLPVLGAYKGKPPRP
ncbi:MAG: hypothetical protein AAF851_19795 [Myxococcota bacterium]